MAGLRKQKSLRGALGAASIAVTLALSLVVTGTPAQAQSQAIYTATGLEDGYPHCRDIFDRDYQQIPANKVLICGWDREMVGAYTRTGGSIAALVERGLSDCFQRLDHCVVFAENNELSVWATAAAGGRRTFFQQAR